MKYTRWAMAMLPLLFAASYAQAGFDHELALDESGIWARKYQTGLETGVLIIEAAGAVWFGNEGELGHTFWQTIDASVISGVGAIITKHASPVPVHGRGTTRIFGSRGAATRVFPAARSRCRRVS